MSERRCLVMGTFTMDSRPWSGVTWEFARVIAEIETTTVLAPPDRFYDKDNPTRPALLRDRLDARWRRMLGKPVPRMRATDVTEDHDLAIYVCQFVYELEEIVQFRHWRDRCARAAVFLLEAWPGAFASQAEMLRKLDLFDHVFVLNGSAARCLPQYTATPVSQLSTASDVLRATPVPTHPARVVDLLCIGRNDTLVHGALLDHAERRDLLYLHDVWRNQHVAGGWDVVRDYNAQLIRRSRYFIVWDPNRQRRGAERRDEVLSTRYFEGAAGGAVLVGSAPDCPEFSAAFDWPDALIPLPADPGTVIDALDADHVRLGRIRAENMRQSLLRHDWSHRWAEVLDAFGLAPTAAHLARRARLESLAKSVSVAEGRACKGQKRLP
jgi:hypothetical protein